MRDSPSEAVSRQGGPTSPDERAFRAHLDEGAFQLGVDHSRWRLVSIAWPFSVIAVSASPRAGSPSEYGFRFELTNYPRGGATAQVWDLGSDRPLPGSSWPTGKSRVAAAFNPAWNPAALYIPCDRAAISGHEQWQHQHPTLLWSISEGILSYLRVIHELLNSGDYTGARDVPPVP